MCKPSFNDIIQCTCIFPLLLTLVLLNILNYLDALARLKERIKKQKEQVSRLSPTNSTPGEAYSNLWNLLVDLSQ